MRAGILTRLKKLEAAQAVRRGGPCVVCVFRTSTGLEYNGVEYQNESSLPGNGGPVLLIILQHETPAQWEARAMQQQAGGIPEPCRAEPEPVIAEPTAKERRATELQRREEILDAKMKSLIAKKRAQRANKRNWK